MKIKFKDSFITDSSLQCEPNCFFLKTEQNSCFVKDALVKEAKIIEPSQAKKLLNINEDIKIIGITGTNGKTTTAAAIYSILLDMGKKVALCGTRGFFINDKQVAPKGLTTPVLLELLNFLALASKENCEFFVTEVSSHALSQNRCQSLEFSAKIYTNLTQDHLDFHKTFENYKNTKESFFKDECLKFINKDATSINFNVKNSYTYSLENPAFFNVKAYSLKDGINALVSFDKKSFFINSKLLGKFNLYNLLAASSCVCVLLKPDLKKLERAISNFAGVSGRMQKITDNIIIDFAHTPNGIEEVLDSLKEKELIVVFGAGGNKDKTKRVLMARAVERFAKLAIITSDNPRDEDPMKIINDIKKGFSKDNFLIIENRKEAIKKALSLQNNEMLVILGKGDETTQEIKGIKYPFNDKIIIEEILKNQGK